MIAKSILCIAISLFLSAVTFSQNIQVQCGPGGCPIPGYPYNQPVPEIREQSGAQLAPERFPEIVLVQAGQARGSATCFYVDFGAQKTYAWTAAHVVSMSKSGIVNSAGKQFRFRTIESSTAIQQFSGDVLLFVQSVSLWRPDWAVLEIDGIVEKSRVLRAPNEGAKIGDYAYVVGWSGGRRLESRRGRITRLSDGLIVVSAQAIPGQSGGAILLDAEDPDTGTNPLVGIISATDGVNCYGTTIFYCIQQIETAAWLPWRRLQEENNLLQRRIQELESELRRSQSEGVPAQPEAPNSPPQSNQPSGGSLEARVAALEKDVAGLKKNIGEIAETIKNLGGSIKELPVDGFLPKEEWGRWQKYIVWGAILIGVWLMYLTLFGKPIVFRNPLITLATRLIPGTIDDTIVALLATGETALAQYLSGKFGVSPQRFEELKQWVDALQKKAKK